MSHAHAAILRQLGAQVLQRDWLSANNIVFAAAGSTPATIVDTGYARHADMTLALVDQALAGAPLERIVNTHLHSDHCGGNGALQAHYQVRTYVPAPSLAAVRAWDEARLSYRPTGQWCPRFLADAAIGHGSVWPLGHATWQVAAAPGHDPDAVLLFEPETRTLISGDALWEDRLAIIFPELAGEDGFGPARRTLDLIETLAPRCVIPGHGDVFGDVEAALAASRARLDGFERAPSRHARHAARALVMFHMLEHTRRDRAELEAWLPQTPIFQRCARLSDATLAPTSWARELVAQLVGDGLLRDDAGALSLAPPAGPSP
ncbi:MBL fold metallo-hydrolase [Ideonella sp. DXS29W]|uniref:MBL fold metallo-hydrolase n=1 Tax=Ideonella lacteola TaxID=2984193 RepID=A0ABU9BQ15_9BURK